MIKRVLESFDFVSVVGDSFRVPMLRASLFGVPDAGVFGGYSRLVQAFSGPCDTHGKVLIMQCRLCPGPG